MIDLLLDRTYKKAGYTIGNLYANAVWFCATLEDEDRGLLQTMATKEILALKQPGATAIPRGRYRVMLSVSPKYKDRSWARPYGGLVPLLMEVPGYSGIRIHPGNTAAHTSGCILPGLNTVKGQVTQSVHYWTRLMDEVLMPAHRRGEEIWITIQ